MCQAMVLEVCLKALRRDGMTQMAAKKHSIPSFPLPLMGAC